MKLRITRLVVAFLSLSFGLSPLTFAQTSAQTASALPRLVRFGGTAKDLNGSPLTGVVGITFAFYSEKTGGSPLWLETQNATADNSGHYTVLLGSTKPEGLPAELFTSEQARWVGVQVSGQAEQPRVLLVSAPYALKAGDAETIGGFPPSAFVLAAPAAMSSGAAGGTAETVGPLAATDVTTTGGTLNYLPIFSGAATIIDSSVFQTGSGTTGKIGIDTTTPATQLDVNGAGTIRGTLTLPATGAATTTGGRSSQGLNLTASSFSSTSSTAVNQIFRWQAEAAANNTTTPSGTLNLQYGLGTATPTETGLKISSGGIVTFAAGQTFPTVTGNETVTGNITSNGSVSATTGFDIGGTPFAFGSAANGNAFLGFAGATLISGKFNLADGFEALSSNTSGSNNTAEGYQALFSNTTGSSNTALGYKANVGAGNLTNATAIGANSSANASNALVLGSINGVNGATANTNVGIGTARPGFLLEVYSAAANNAQIEMASAGTDAAISVNNKATGGREYWIDSGSGTAGIGAGNFGIHDRTAAATRFVINSVGNVGIGTTTPGATLEVDGPNQLGMLIQAPESGVGAGLDLNTTGSGGLHWEILDTGSTSSQGANKLNIRNVNAGADILTILPSGNVGIGTTTPQYTLDVEGAGVGVHGIGTDGVQGVGSSFGVIGSTSAGIAGTYGYFQASSLVGTEGPWDLDYDCSGYPTVFCYGLTALPRAGVWADTNWDGDFAGEYAPALLATTDANVAAILLNNSNTVPTFFVYNYGSGGNGPGGGTSSSAALQAGGPGGTCTITGSGDAACTGALKSVVATASSPGAQRVETYAVQSAENWFEDAGTAQLVNGAGRVNLEAVFGKTVNTGVEYHVFLTPDGDCKGLYVSAKTASGFEVRELGGGASNIAFEYRIMAKRVGYENVRLANVTERVKRQQAQSQKMQRPARPSAVPQSRPQMPTPPVPVWTALQPSGAQTR